MKALVVSLALAGVALAGCGGGAAASSETAGPASSVASAPAGSGAANAAPTAAACDEINRLTREQIKGLTDDSPDHWQAFAFSLQTMADASSDPEFQGALTDLATAALTASDDLASGTPVGKATSGFLDAVPAVDHFCKLAGKPLV